MQTPLPSRASKRCLKNIHVDAVLPDFFGRYPFPIKGNPERKNLSTYAGRNIRLGVRGYRTGHWLEQGSIIERSEQDPHKGQGNSARGLALLDSETRETLARGRWRQPSLTRPTLALVLALVLVLHALFALVLWYALQARVSNLVVGPVETEQALVVRFIDHTSEPVAAPPPPPATPTPPQAAPARVRPVVKEKPRRDAMVVQDHQAAPAPAASASMPAASSLFAKDGSVRLAPTQTNYATTNPRIKPAKPSDDSQIMQHDYNQMHTKTTRFEKYFPPPNETAGGKVGRHVGDAIKAIAASICDPKKPGFNPLCGTPPIPPSPKDGDERLNLPSRALADDPDPPKPPPLSTCFAEYRDTKPLSYGCPIDTPDLAFKAEVRECNDLFNAGKRLKPWCPPDTPKRAAAEAAASSSSSSQ